MDRPTRPATPIRATLVILVVVAASTARANDWGESVKLVDPGPIPASWLGASVAAGGSLALAGAPNAYVGGSVTGSVLVFDADSGVLLRKLAASDAADNDRFGFSVDVDGTVAVVGAYGNQDFGHTSGAAYLFDTTTGTELHKLLPDDGAMQDRFGWSVAIRGSLVVVGSPKDDDHGDGSGSAYLFDAATGRQLAKLLPDDGREGDAFGYAVGTDQGCCIVGAPFDDDDGASSGSAYLFDPGTGRQTAKLRARDGEGLFLLGHSVAIEGPLAVAGAYATSSLHPGFAYVFDATTGEPVSRLAAEDGASQDWLGFRLAMHGTAVLVSAPQDEDNGWTSGSSYVFDASTGQQVAKLLPSDGAPADSFGWGVDLDGSHAVVGAVADDTGSAYVFDLPILPYGVGCPGLGGSRPRLLLHGTPTGGQTIALSIDDGLGGALSLTVVGVAPAWLPLGGACALLVAAPSVLQVHALGGSGPGNGQLTRTASLPPNLPIGTVRLQAFVADAASPTGFSSSNGLRVQLQ